MEVRISLYFTCFIFAPCDMRRKTKMLQCQNAWRRDMKEKELVRELCIKEGKASNPPNFKRLCHIHTILLPTPPLQLPALSLTTPL
jgi:hypothetical protein